MKQGQRTNYLWSAFRRATAAFLMLLLFTLIIVVNKTEAGWVFTEGEEVALKFIDSLQKRDLKAVNRFLAPRLLTEEHQANVENAVKNFPEGSIKKISRVNVQINYDFNGQGRQEELEFYIEFYRTASLMKFIILQKGEQLVIDKFRFDPAPMGMMKRFPFNTISWIQPKNVFMAVAVLSVLLMIAALVLWFIKPLKMKLLWLPVIFAGLMEASAQWVDDGPWAFNLLAFKVPPVWIDAAGQDPWSIVVAFPLGAIVVVILAVTAQPAMETLTIPTRPQAGRQPRNPQPGRQPRNPQPRPPRPQPMKVGK